MTNTVALRIISVAAAASPILGIRLQNGLPALELTGESGRSLAVQRKADLTGTWLDWTNLTGSGSIQLIPLNDTTNSSAQYFRAYAQ
jgi:2-methylcitrate dehydratase PrpD